MIFSKKKIKTMRTTLFYKCTCGHPLHQLQFSYWDDDDKMIFIDYVSTRGSSFWQRLKIAFWYLFNKEDILHADVVLEKDDIREMMEAFQKFLVCMNHDDFECRRCGGEVEKICPTCRRLFCTKCVTKKSEKTLPHKNNQCWGCGEITVDYSTFY